MEEQQGGQTYGRAGSETLDYPALVVRVGELLDGVLPLDDLELRQPLADKLNDAAPRHAVENDLVVQRRGNELRLPRLLVLPDDEEVTRARFGAEPLVAVQPQDLVEALIARLGGREERGPVVRTDLGVPETAGPRADRVVGGGLQPEPAGRRGHVGHEGADDVKHGLGGGLDAQLGLGADHGGAEVEEGARAGLGEPAGAVDGHEGHHELLELGGGEAGEGDARRGHEHARGVAVGAEEAELAVVATVRLEALEALSRVVEDRSRRHEGDGPVGPELGRGPSRRRVPGRRDHVVGADGLGARVGGLGGRDLARGLGVLVGELRGVELGAGSGLGAVRAVGRGGGGGSHCVGVYVFRCLRIPEEKRMLFVFGGEGA